MSASKMYTSMTLERDMFINRAREVSELTLPSFFTGDRGVDESYDKGELPTSYQSFGARAVRNLSSKLNTTLLPPNNPFFNLTIDESAIKDLPQEVDRSAVDIVLNDITRVIHKTMESSNLRVEMSESTMSLLIDGNPLIYVDEDGKVELFRLDQFVIKRDRSGKILKIIIKEEMDFRSLPEDFTESLSEEDKKDNEGNVEIYTVVELNKDGKYQQHQEAFDKVIKDTLTIYPKDVNPWIAPRLSKISGESYGRSFCEEYIGDLRSLEGLSKALLEMSAVAARIIYLVNPASQTELDDLHNAPNGGFVHGVLGDISELPSTVAGDFSVTKAQANDIEQRLSSAFLLLSSIQRNAERVTAEEVRLMAQELDNGLGNVYSILSSEFQGPLVRAYMYRLRKAKKIDYDKSFTPNIVTGIDALGRGQDLGRLNAFVQSLAGLQNAGIIPGSVIKPEAIINRMAAAYGVDIAGLIKTREEIAEEQAAKQQQEFANSKMGSQLVNTMASAAQQTDENQEPTEQGISNE